jgi:hypothetical protein
MIIDTFLCIIAISLMIYLVLILKPENVKTYFRLHIIISLCLLAHSLIIKDDFYVLINIIMLGIVIWKA